MDWQGVIAGGLVAGSTVWAAWMLLPAAPRAWCRARLGLRAPAAAGCGGCSGCGGTAPVAGTAQAVRFVRRLRA